MTEIVSGLILYFDKALGNNLLYRFERPQLVEQRRLTKEEKPMSEIYGAEHLLRLFGEFHLHRLLTPVNFGAFIAYTNIDTESLNILREHINDILRYVDCHSPQADLQVDDQGERPHLLAPVRDDNDVVPGAGKDVTQCKITRFSSGVLRVQIAECNVDTTLASLAHD